MPNLSSSVSEDRRNFLAINQQTLSRLLTFVDFAAGLTIGFIEIDREQERDWIVEWLIDAPQCHNIQFLVLTYESPDLRFLLDDILKSLPQDLPTDKDLVLIIKGLEYSIGHTEYPPILQNLNFVRDAFVDAVPYPILFCLPSYQITSFANYAPDFWAWKSGLFKFEYVEKEPIFSPSLPVEYSSLRRTPEPQSRIDLLERLLDEVSTDLSNRNLSTKVSILEQLGNSHRSRKEWKQAENDLTSALKIIAENPSLSIDKTNIWIELADVYREQRKYDQAEELCQQILALDRLSPYQWAEVNNVLGLIYTENSYKNGSERLEKAIACFQSVLKIYTYEDFPQQWAQIQNSLGNLHRGRIWSKHRLEHEVMAIEYYQAALQVLTETDFPQEWAEIQLILARIYGGSMENKTENLEMTIEYYQAAARVFTETDFPQEWARIQLGLGDTYRSRILGNRSDNLEQAIECYQAALRVITKPERSRYNRDILAEEWAYTQNMLGITYKKRIKGEKAENIKSAIECYQNALTVYNLEWTPELWKWTKDLIAEAEG